MNRRTALKNLTLSLGYVVSAPTIFSVLSSCKSDVVTWKPVFLTEREKHMVTHLVDIIMPTSNIPGGLDVNIPEFLDRMYLDVETKLKKNQFQKGAAIFAESFQKKTGKDILKGSKEDILTLFEAYFKLSEEKQEEIIEKQLVKESKITASEKSNYLLYKFLFSVRYYSLFGYYSSEKVGKEVLNYDPVPGVYHGCVPLDEIGNAWSL
jgi:hypothetical protein